MDHITFAKKYPDLDTYDKFINRIVELHKTGLYHQNKSYIDMLGNNIKGITEVIDKAKENINNLIAFKNGFNDFDGSLIFNEKKFKTLVNGITTKAENLKEQSLNLNYMIDQSRLPAAYAILTEKDELVEFLNYNLHNLDLVCENNDIIEYVTIENKSLNSIAKVDTMRNAYKEVIGNKLKPNDNKNSQFIEQYKAFKRNQNKNQKVEVIVEKPVDSIKPNDGREA